MSAGPAAKLEIPFGEYLLDDAFDEMRDASGQLPSLSRAGRYLGTSAAGGITATQAVSRTLVLHPGHHLHCLRGKTPSELYIAVHVEASDAPPALHRKMPIPEDWSALVERAEQPPETPIPLIDVQEMQQQQWKRALDMKGRTALPGLERQPRTGGERRFSCD